MFVAHVYEERAELCCVPASGHPTLPGQISCKWTQLVTGGVENSAWLEQIDDCGAALSLQLHLCPSFKGIEVSG